MARNRYPEETVKRILDVAETLFLTKGYDATSIQEIIEGLGGLSKGAVYHHFQSKEDIFYAVSSRHNAQQIEELRNVRDSGTMTGLQKLKRMFEVSLSGANQELSYATCPDMLANPRLLAIQLQEIMEDVVPHYVCPVLEEGIRDGSIHTDYPEQLSEVLILLTNLWLNPSVLRGDAETMLKRVRCFDALLRSMGVELLDEALLRDYTRYCQNAAHKD